MNGFLIHRFLPVIFFSLICEKGVYYYHKLATDKPKGGANNQFAN
jgi:hypothetical protein